MAKIYFYGGGPEHTLILGVREAYYQPFFATDWTDLRLGFFLSVCGNADPAEDNTITGLTEEIGTPGTFERLPWTDRSSIGIVNYGGGPGEGATVFCGYSNLHESLRNGYSHGTSKIVSSDEGIGTSNTNFWRVENELSHVDTVTILDHGSIRNRGTGNSEMHLVQTLGGGGEYCTLIMMRFRRDDARGRANIITMTVKQGTNSGDILYSAAPSKTLLETNLEDFPDTVQQLGPVELSNVPDTLWAYWPFYHSRLRIHCYGILKAA